MIGHIVHHPPLVCVTQGGMPPSQCHWVRTYKKQMSMNQGQGRLSCDNLVFFWPDIHHHLTFVDPLQNRKMHVRHSYLNNILAGLLAQVTLKDMAYTSVGPALLPSLIYPQSTTITASTCSTPITYSPSSPAPELDLPSLVGIVSCASTKALAFSPALLKGALSQSALQCTPLAQR